MLGAQRFEEMPHRPEVDLPAEIKVRFGLARHDGGEVVDQVEPFGGQRGPFGRRGQVADTPVGACPAFGKGHVVQGEAYGRAVESLGFEFVGQFLTHHAAAAKNENPHHVSIPLRARSSR